MNVNHVQPHYGPRSWCQEKQMISLVMKRLGVLQTETENNNLEISYIMLYQKRYAKVSGSIHFGTVKCK